MHVLFGWPGLTVAGIVGLAVCGLHWVFTDFLLDRFGDLSDRLRRRESGDG